MADLVHRSSRTIDQRAQVVHDRLLQLAVRLRDEAPPVPAGSQAATLLGVSGPLGLESLFYDMRLERVVWKKRL